MYSNSNANTAMVLMLFYIIFLLVILLVILPIPARIASKKGYSYIGFLFFATFFYPIALVVALLIDDKNSYKSESDKADTYDYLESIGIPFSTEGEPLGIGD